MAIADSRRGQRVHRCLGVVGLVLAGLTGACGSPQDTPTPTRAVSEDTWAVVDGREIKRDHVEKAYRRTLQGSQTLTNEEALTAKLGLLNELIVQDILIAKAGELKIEVTQAELDKAYEEAKSNMPDEAFQQELKNRNLTAEDMREDLRRDLLTQKVLEREVLSKVSVTDQEITSFYEANRAQFSLPEDSYRIAQIVITPERDPQVANRTGDDATTAEAAAKKAQMLMEKLKGGAAFDELARDYSEDPQSAPQGGDLGFVPVSALKQAPPALRDAVLKSSPGTVQSVSQGGGHTLVLVVAHEPAGQRDLNTPTVRDNISNTLRGRKEQLLRTAYLSAIRNDADVVNYLARRVVEGRLPQ